MGLVEESDDLEDVAKTVLDAVEKGEEVEAQVRAPGSSADEIEYLLVETAGDDELSLSEKIYRDRIEILGITATSLMAYAGFDYYTNSGDELGLLFSGLNMAATVYLHRRASNRDKDEVQRLGLETYENQYFLEEGLEIEPRSEEEFEVRYRPR